MFEYIYEWLKNLSIYTILISVILQVLPDEEYKKYIRFFTGMVLIVLLVTPLFQLFDMKKEFDQIYRSREYETMIQELKEAEQMAVEGIYELEE